ncbi:MAG: CocE/NonD family hydrolase [Microbacterium sp.]|uniref:CocE/NonD family hydrolase n=1 Tax=Microbacterium sp. TaxID=51671 RepID=UPI003F805B1D
MIDVHRVGPGTMSPLATQHMVRMRDGVRLATDVYLPDGDDAPGPVVLTRLPYDKNGRFTPIDLFAEYYMSRGYRVVAQDVRGKFRSEGERQIFANEADDGYDTIDWVSRQQWCDGNVAMWGNSYYGFTQLAAMTAQHPALKAIAPRLTGTGLGQPSIAAPGDLVRDVEWSAVYTYPLNFFHDNDNLFWDVDWTTRPYLDSIRAFLTENGDGSSRSFDQWYPHRHVLRPFRNLPHPFEARAIPTLFTIGWWDNCAVWSWRDVEEMNSRPAWRDALHLLIEPIDHYSYVLGADDSLALMTDEQWRARIPRIAGPTADFFDVYVRRVPDAAPIPRVRYTVAHGGGVRTAASWPPEGQELVLAATAGGGLQAGAPAAVAIAESTLEWTHDPDDLVPSPAPDPFKCILDGGDPARVSAHPGVVVFRGEPLVAPVEIVGRVRARGRFASTGPCMDVFVRLIDMDESGAQTRIARGNVHIIDASAPLDVEIAMDHAGYRVRAGHRLVVEVASSDFPEYVPQPGTGEDPLAAGETAANTQSLWLGGDAGLSVIVTTPLGQVEGVANESST